MSDNIIGGLRISVWDDSYPPSVNLYDDKGNRVAWLMGADAELLGKALLLAGQRVNALHMEAERRMKFPTP